MTMLDAIVRRERRRRSTGWRKPTQNGTKKPCRDKSSWVFAPAGVQEGAEISRRPLTAVLFIRQNHTLWVLEAFNQLGINS